MLSKPVLRFFLEDSTEKTAIHNNNNKNNTKQIYTHTTDTH